VLNKAKWLPLGLLALASLLVAAALLQYRWINRAAEADLLEHRQSLNSALAGVKSEFNAAVQELLPMFRPSPDVPEGGLAFFPRGVAFELIGARP
jgi:hypothetical protein